MKNMKDYPIFEHLKQFSTLVDPQGNFMETDEGDARPNEEIKRVEEPSEDQGELAREGGEQEDCAYEGGDSQNGQQPKNGNPVNGTNPNPNG